MAEFRVFGFGAFDFLQRLLTNDLHKIAELGQAQYTLHARRRRPHHRRPDRLPHRRPRVPDHRERSNRRDGLRVAHRARARRTSSSSTSPTARRSSRCRGPRRSRIVDRARGRGLGAAGALHDRRGDARRRVPVLVARTGYTGEDGVEIVCRAADAPRALARCCSRFPRSRPCGLGARDTLRLEMGYPLYGSDMDRTIDPISAGLGWVVPEGEDRLHRRRGGRARCARAGPTRKLVGLTVEGGIPRHGYRRVARGRGGG